MRELEGAGIHCVMMDNETDLEDASSVNSFFQCIEPGSPPPSFLTDTWAGQWLSDEDAQSGKTEGVLAMRLLPIWQSIRYLQRRNGRRRCTVKMILWQ